jgi:hypothetical protein
MPTTTKDTENMTNDIAEAIRDLRLAEQEILAESLRVKSERIHELETEVRLLKDLLVQWQTAPRPQTQPFARRDSVPRRWKVKT